MLPWGLHGMATRRSLERSGGHLLWAHQAQRILQVPQQHSARRPASWLLRTAAQLPHATLI